MNIFEKGLLTYLSSDQLQKIQSCHVGIGGCGGLGSNTAIMLVRCGFKYLTLIDFDYIEASNLNRQQYGFDDIKQPKAPCLAKKLLAINPNVSCNAVNDKWQRDMPNDPFLSCNILVEAFDYAKTKSCFIDYYSDLVKYLVSGNGLAGITGPSLSIRQRGNIYFVGDGMTEASPKNPPMAPRVTTCAAMMAEIVLSLTLNERPFSISDGTKEL